MRKIKSPLDGLRGPVTRQAGQSAPTTARLLENGSYRLLEDGTYRLQE